MNWNEVISILPLVIEDLKKEYLLINPMIRDDIFGILEKHCVVVYYPLENESNCGFHTKRFVKNKLEDFVYINTAKPVANQVFAAAHELGHVWRVADKVIEKMSDKVSFSSEEEELLINRFAAELLMPEKEFRKTFNVRMKEFNLDGKKIKLEDLIRVVVVIMNDYMVPYESVRKRLVETNIISTEMGFYMDKHREIIGVLVDEYSKELNTVVDNFTGKKTIPGLRSLIEKIEENKLLDEYTICKIKKDFDINDIRGTDDVLNIGMGD